MSPTPKKQRTCGDCHVSFTISDESGNRSEFVIRGEVCEKIPFLERKRNTIIGSDGDGDDRGRVSLPAGCSLAAFAALVHRVAAVDYVTSHLEAPDMDAAMELLRTADYLLMEDLLSEIIVLCKRHIKTEKDIELLKEVSIAGIRDLTRDLTGGILVSRMKVDAIARVARSFRKNSKISKGQVQILLDWLRAGARSKEEINTVLVELSLEGGCWFTKRYHYSQKNLKEDSKSWIQRFATLAVERPAYSQVFEYFTDPLHAKKSACNREDLKVFVESLMVPFQGRLLTVDGIRKLLPLFFRYPFLCSDYVPAYRSITPFIDKLCERSYSVDELKFVLPEFCKLNDTGAMVRLLMNAETDGLDYGVDFLMQQKDWIGAVDPKFFSMLKPELQVLIAAEILPEMEKANWGLKEHLEDLIASGKL